MNKMKKHETKNFKVFCFMFFHLIHNYFFYTLYVNVKFISFRNLFLFYKCTRNIGGADEADSFYFYHNPLLA